MLLFHQLGGPSPLIKGQLLLHPVKPQTFGKKREPRGDERFRRKAPLRDLLQTGQFRRGL